MKKRKYFRKKRIVTFKGRVLDVMKVVESSTNIIQSVKQKDAHKYREPYYFGGKGTYRVGYPETSIYLFLYVYIGGYGTYRIDIHEDALEANNRSRITDKFVLRLQAKLKGMYLLFTKSWNGFQLFNKDQLCLCMSSRT